MGDPLGGHLMSGHVDGIAQVVSAQSDARSLRVRVAPPVTLARFIAAKGSVALDGVSLTVNDVTSADFGINLIPHTVEVTTFDELTPGRVLNIEVDLFARYAERLLPQSAAASVFSR
jgi:riboflavin synthase